MIAHVPRISDLIAGFETTMLLMRAKWRTIRSLKSKAVIWLGVATILFSVIAASYSGLFVKSLAQEGGDTAAQQFAMTYLASFMRGELGAIGAGVLGLSVLSAIVAPFTGAVVTSLLSQRDLVTFGATRWHRFTDSLLGQVSSSISILQLIALSAISSMLTLQGGRGLAMVLTWAVWWLLVLLSTLTTWISEYLYRRFGTTARLTIVGVVFAIILIAVLFDPNNGSTLFGLGTQYAYLVQHIGLDSDPRTISTVFGVVLGLGFILFTLAAMVSSVALTFPETGAMKTKKKQRTKKAASLPPTASPTFEIFKMLFFSLLRSKESRKPLLAASVLGAFMVAVTGGEQTIATAFTVMVPLVIALAWGANVFGILGGGLTWLASQPKIMKRLPYMVFTIQSFFTLSLFMIVWLPGVLLGRVELSILPGVILSAFATTVLIARSCTHKSVFKPHPTHFGGRGETILPPATTLGYTFRFALWQGQYGVILLSLDDFGYQIALAFLAITWSAFRMTRINDKWKLPETRKAVIDVVAQD